MTAIQPIIAAFLTLFAAWIAVRTALQIRSGEGTAKDGAAVSRQSAIGQLLTGVSFLLFVRLITDFGGWTGWFVWVWLAGIVGFAAGIAVIAAHWSSVPARAAKSHAARSERTGIWSGAVLVALIVAALVVPGLVIA